MQKKDLPPLSPLPNRDGEPFSGTLPRVQSLPPTDVTSSEPILPKLVDQPLHLSQVYIANDGSSLREGKHLISRLDSAAPVRILHGQVLRKLREYNDIRNELSGVEVLPALDVRLGASGLEERLVGPGQFSRGAISRIGEGTERDTIQINVWFDLEEIKKHSQVNVDTALMNELSNINLLLGVLNAGLKTNLDPQGVPQTFDQVWAAAQNTTAHPFFESGTYAIDIGLGGIHAGKYNDLAELRKLIVEQSEPTTLVDTFNSSVARATPSYVRGFMPHIQRQDETIVRYRPGLLDSVQPPSQSAANDDQLYLSPSNVVFLNSSYERMVNQIKSHLDLYGASEGVELTTQRVHVPEVGEVVVPALRLRDAIVPAE